MDDMLLDYSWEHFAKAQGSPFTTDPLQHLLNYDGLTTFGNQVLQGRAHINTLPINDATKALLQHLCNKSTEPAAQIHPLNYDELQNGIKKWPEKTSTSPSGQHLGIYKSLQCHFTEKDEQTQPMPTTQAMLMQGCDILYLIFDIMSLALQHSYMLKCLKIIWTVFIEKELGNPDLAHLHCIMIFEADWQLLLKWHLSYGFLPKSKLVNALTPAQGRGQKGCSAIDQATQQIIEMEITNLNQCTAIDLFLDLHHCFHLMSKCVTTWCADGMARPSTIFVCMPRHIIS